tara:strand:- start:779 stop:1723 length:945 start_codon:yes stop_codon:yes gene_type:complete
MNLERILLIGGTGALGQQLIERHYINNDIIVFSRDEHKHVELAKRYPDLEYRIGDVKDTKSIIQALHDYKPTVVINTAALKHVPVCENNAIESVKTNIMGHQNLIEAIMLSKHTIDYLLFISTDKACKPINVYGMCKAISEKLYLNLSEKQDKIKVGIVRYGNVLNSTGSVVPYFQSLLKHGQKWLPVTHTHMTRFIITLDQAIDLLDYAYKTREENHGCVIVPRLKSLKIIDLVNAMGARAEIIGIRAGEKLHEEMVSVEESMKVRDEGKYLVITREYINADKLGFKGESFASDSQLMSMTQLKSYLKKVGVT